MNVRWFLFPFLVFLGGCCYGPSSPTIKLAYEAGFTANDVVMSQYFYGWLILLVLIGAGFFRGSLHRPVSPTPWTIKRLGRMFATGASIALVSVCYCFSLQSVPASVSVILLFQFTWIGVIIQALVERKLPSRRTITAVAILILGTILAAGLVGSRYVIGFVLCALYVSARSYRTRDASTDAEFCDHVLFTCSLALYSLTFLYCERYCFFRHLDLWGNPRPVWVCPSDVPVFDWNSPYLNRCCNHS